MRSLALCALLPAAALIAGCHDDVEIVASIDPWALRFGDASDQFAIQLAANAGGDLAIAGSFSGAIDLGGGAFSTAPDDLDLYLATINADGTPRWSGATGGSSMQIATAAAFDRKGRAIFTGLFHNQIDLGEGPIEALSADTFVAAFDPDGALAWTKHFSADDGGPSGAGDSMPMALAAGGDGTIAVAGFFSGTFGLGGPPLTSDGSADQSSAFVAKLDADGGHVFSAGFGGATHLASAVAADARGEVVVVGENQGEIRLGDATFTTPSPGGRSAFLARFSAGGAPLWLQQLGGAGDSQALAVAVDAVGNAYVGGCFSGQLIAGDQTFVSFTGGCDGFVMAVAPTGELRWITTLPEARVSAIAVDPSGHVHAGGDYRGAPLLGPDPLPFSASAAAYVAELDGAGALVKVRAFGAAGHVSYVSGIAAAAGGLTIAGSFDGTLNVTPPLQSEGGLDLYVARLP